MHLAMVNAHRDASPGTIQFLLGYDESKATINTRDKDGFLPLHLLALGEVPGARAGGVGGEVEVLDLDQRCESGQGGQLRIARG